MALSVHVAILVVSPALHHDLECQVKSPAHCQACIANPVAPRAEPGFTLVVDLAPAGEVVTTPEMRPSRPTFSTAAGRSPPAQGL